MSLFPTNTLVNNLHTFTYADMIGDMDVTPSGIALLNPPSGVIWDEKSFLTRGKITHGSSLTPGYLSGMSDSGALASSIWWNAVAPWISIYPLIADTGVTNGVTNAYIKISKIRGYFWSISAQKWVRIGPEGNGLPSIAPGKWSTDYTTPYGAPTTIYAKADGLPAYLPWHGAEQVQLHNPIIANTKFPDIGGDDITGMGGSDCGGLFIICQTQLCSVNDEPFIGGDGIPKYAASIGADYYPSTDSAYNTTVLAGRNYLQAAGGSKFKRIPANRSPVMHYFITGVGADTWVSNDSAYTVANGLSSMYQSAAQLQDDTPILI